MIEWIRMANQGDDDEGDNDIELELNDWSLACRKDHSRETRDLKYKPEHYKKEGHQKIGREQLR